MVELISNGNIRLSDFIKDKTVLKHGEVLSLLKNKDVKVNGKRISSDVKLNIDDLVAIYISEDKLKTTDILPIYFDDNILVVKKEKGVSSDEVFSVLKSKETELYYIHRLDLNTDGIMVFAKNKVAETELLLGFKNRTFKKYYHAVILGSFSKDSGILKGYLKKDKNASKVEIFDNKVNGALPIITAYKTVKKGKETSLVEVELVSGRTHQIRAHFAYFNHPVIGDGKYGNISLSNIKKVKSQLLTAKKLVLYFDKNSPLYYLNEKVFEIESNLLNFVI